LIIFFITFFTQVDKHIRRLDSDLSRFEEELKLQRQQQQQQQQQQQNPTTEEGKMYYNV